MSTATWYCTHVYYYEPDKDPLILDAVRPLFRRLRPMVEGLHLARHWLRGPHLRLYVKAPPRLWTDVLRPVVDGELADYLAAHPSTAVLDVERELAQHRLLAARERERGPLAPWFPDNSVQHLPHDDRAHVIRSPRTAELMAEFATEGADVLFDMLDRVRAGEDDRELLALELLLATSATAQPPITRSFASYRSHAEGFIHQCGDPDAVRAAFDAHYATRHDALVDRVRTVLGTLDGTGGGARFAPRWAALCEDYARRVEPLIEEQLVFPPVPDEPPSSLKGLAPFHALMFGNRAYWRAVFQDPAFLRYRFLINCAYLQVGRLGLTPYQRFRTCHAAACAVEDVYGINAIESIRAFVDSHPNP